MVRRSTRVRTLTYKAQAMEEEKNKKKQIAELSENRNQKVESCKKARAEIDAIFNKENDRPVAKAVTD